MFERPEVLQGATLKISPPTLEHALYITINHRIGPDGLNWPVEIFINSKDAAQFQYVTCITRLLSAVLRQAEEFPWYAFDELVQTFDPAGGSYIIPKKRGAKAHGLISHVGVTLLEYCTGELRLQRPVAKRK
jgi:hypothetical protein